MTIPELSAELAKANEALQQYCRSMSEAEFFFQPTGKWSAAQQIKHLTTATNMAKLAFTLPVFLVGLAGGKANRPSRSYEELVMKYKTRLAQGGKASGRYIPKPIPASVGKDKLLDNFSRAMNNIAVAINRKRNETQLDRYVAPHPLLGKITLRELCYFTIYHTYHHLESIRQIAANK